ncbi:MAG: hydroxymethylglutaryl-CoA synthase [Pseudomonadota bacterium]
MSKNNVGISGFGFYLPPYRVDLEQWSKWTDNDWSKIHAVVGDSFRMCGPEQGVYTLAANAVLRLIENYDLDPSRIKFLGLGTESSIDNSAGAIIVKGIVNQALGDSPLPRDCEVPEFKHACLGGVYGMKAALRYLCTDAQPGDQAIVVCSDIAEYARGSTGEQTQGAGAIAMLLEANPRLAKIDLTRSGSASDYRGADFRKPFIRFLDQKPRINAKIQDLPVFNGKYSTTCYVDEVLHAMRNMFERHEEGSHRVLEKFHSVFMHRPYRRMPETGWAMSHLLSLALGSEQSRLELEDYCKLADVAMVDMVQEMTASPDIHSLTEQGTVDQDVYPLTMQVLRAYRKTSAYRDVVSNKMSLGSDLMMHVGNIYSGALFGWMAAGFEDAVGRHVSLDNQEILAIGYGSGDAAEVIPMEVVHDWQEAASKIHFAESFEPKVDLSQEQYEKLHDDGDPGPLEFRPAKAFVIDHVGENDRQDFTDTGIEYYKYLD